MRMIWITCAVLFCTTAFGHAQETVKDILDRCHQMENATSVHLGAFTMKLASLFTETMGVRSIDALTIDECLPQERNKIRQCVYTLKDPKYETLVTTNEDGEQTKILVRIEDELIREMVIFNFDNSINIVHLQGKIKPSDIAEVVKAHAHEQ